MTPLRRQDVAEAARLEGLDAEAFVAEVAQRRVGALAARPLTLAFLISRYKRRRALPESQKDLYEDGCRHLCEELNPNRRSSNLRGALDSAQRLAIAARIAALTVLSGRNSILAEPSAEIDDEGVRLQDISGGSESAQGTSFAVSEAHVRETLMLTGLFHAGGTGNMVWVHQNYADFLAAKRLERVPLAQATHLLMDASDPSTVIPQLQGTAAWLASMRMDFREHLLQRAPQVLLRSDLTASQGHLPVLVDRILRLLDEHQLVDDQWSDVDYASLQHGGLADQLAPYITDTGKNAIVRRVAIDIAQACRMFALRSTLLAVALDPDDAHGTRVQAAHALHAMGMIEELMPLARGEAGPDLHNQLRGIALGGLYPLKLTTSEVLPLLMRARKEEAFLGEYEMFVAGLPQHITHGELPATLAWCAALPEGARGLPLSSFVEAIVSRAWGRTNEREVLQPLVSIIRGRLRRHESIVEVRSWFSLDRESPSDLEEVTRRHVLEELATAVVTPPMVSLLLHSEPALLRQPDLPWLVARFEGTSSAPAQKVWSIWIRSLFRTETDPSSIDLVLQAVTRCPGLLATLELQTVELGSERARALKAEHDEWTRHIVRQSTGSSAPSPGQLIAHCLDASEMGDVTACWLELTRVMALEAGNSGNRSKFDVDLLETPGWRDSAPSTRARIVEVAKRYVDCCLLDDADWIATKEYLHVTLDAYRAIRLLTIVESSWVKELNRDTWLKITPIIIGFPRDDDREADRALIDRVYELFPDVVLSTIGSLLDAQDDTSFRDSMSAVMDVCWGPPLAHLVLARACIPTFPARPLVQILEWGIKKGDARFLKLAVQLLEDALQHDSKRRVQELGLLLLESSAEICWPSISAVLNQEEMGTALMSAVASRSRRDVADIARDLSPQHVADLYVWIESRYPSAEDPKRGVVRGTRAALSDLRDRLLRHLRSSGDPLALAAIGSIVARLPDRNAVRWEHVLAKRAVNERQWTPPAPSVLLDLLLHDEKRFVESGEHLMDVIVESLERLAGLFQGETPQARDVWDRWCDGSHVPNDENTFSDHIRRHLRRELTGKGIVANREVEIRPSVGEGTGQRTDIHVSAVRETAAGMVDLVTAIVEVKGAWNRNVKTDMQTQLVDRYLHNNPGTHGLYLVGWFTCERWSAGDARRKDVPWPTYEDAVNALEAQASQLSMKGAKARAYVLDARLGGTTRGSRPVKRKRRP